jgi:hypothetical protein
LEEEADEAALTADMDQLEEKVENWSKILHPNNYLVVKLKKRLFDLYVVS